MSRSKPSMKVWALTRYGPLGASSRMRTLQYIPALAMAGCTLQVEGLLSDAYLRALYKGKRIFNEMFVGYACRLWRLLKPIPKDIDCLWVEKELWPWAPAWLECLLLSRRPWVLDLDDAIFHNYDQHRIPLLRRLYGRKIDKLMRHASIVTAGSPYLAERAKAAGARDVRLIPTTVDLSRYPASVERHQPPDAHTTTIGWIGSPATARYLDAVKPALGELAKRFSLRLHVIGATAPEIEGMNCVSVQWSEASEVASILELDIGIMPLIDSSWERGKCGYKLIQYMACGLPVVASPVGVNTDLVTPRQNGLLADNQDQWISTLQELITAPALRASMGRSGREQVERRYCLQVASHAVFASLQDAARASNQNFLANKID